MSSIIINQLTDIENYSYLELGVNDNLNFNEIKCKNKFSVDMNGQAMFTGTTDEYFDSLPFSEKFDIIFIDANHDYDYVLRDFNNSIDHANKWILLHDMIPPDVRFTKRNRCSDSYRILYYMLKEEKFEIYPMNTNYGLTLIRMPANKIHPAESYKSVSYNEFLKFIEEIHLYSTQEIINILRRGS